jgi:hypothetical protein
MKQVNLTINVSDNKFKQLIELLTKNFGSENVTEGEVFEVSSWQKETVLQRLNEYKNNPESALDFEHVMSDFEARYEK